MSGPLVQLAPPRLTMREVMRIAASMTATCAIGAAILGGIFIATNRYSEQARVRSEQSAVKEMLGLAPTAQVMLVHQYLDAARQQIIYRSDADPSRPGQEIVFDYDGTLVRHQDNVSSALDEKGLQSLGRLFVATEHGAPIGFVTEAEIQGYKNRIRFFVAIDSRFEIAGVRVIEHEEDPGLGAEVATPWFQGQFVARPLATLNGLDVTRDPMPEDWRAALRQRDQMTSDAWRAKFVALLERESPKPIYAVTGATISSRALTNGVRSAAQHFQRRWALLAPYLQPQSGGHA